MIRSKNFGFELAEDIYKFILLRRDYGKVRRKLCYIHIACLNTI